MAENNASNAPMGDMVSLSDALELPGRKPRLKLSELGLLDLIQEGKGPSLCLVNGEVRVRKDVFLAWEEAYANFLEEKRASKQARWRPAARTNTYACTNLFACL